jgi:hypothetical protein
MKTFTGKITGTGNRCIDGCYRLVIIVDGYAPRQMGDA